MKTLKNHLKVVALFLSVLILFQGCTVYKSNSVSINEAVKADTKVRVVKKNGEKKKYIRVVEPNDGYFYGVKKVNGLVKHIPLKKEDIAKINLKDQKVSKLWTIATPLIIIGIAIGVFAIALDNANYGSSN